MKRELTGMAMTILLLGTASCSQSETDGIEVVPPAGKGVTLGVNVGVSTGAKTKAAVSGTAITYLESAYATTDHAIGLVVSNEDISGYYAAETPNFDIGYAGYGTLAYDICFTGDKEGKNWKAIDVSTSFPTAATAEKVKTFFLDKNRGQIFAYFPFDKTKAKKATIANNKVTYPIDIVATSVNKLATVNNSVKTFTTAWTDNTAKNAVNILAEETDYLYFEPIVDKGRYVNNGSKANASGAVTAPDGSNADANPGNSISLTMKHALSMVTFRLYDKDLVVKAPTADVSATTLGSVKSFKIENVAAADGPLKIGSTTMDLAVNGTSPIDVTAGSYTSGSIERTLDKYLLIRARETGSTNSEGTAEVESASTYLFANGGDGREAANYISTLVYPATLAENAVKVTFDILEPGVEAALSFPLTTNLTVPVDGGWLPNKNYIYTFSVSKKGLNVVDVTVTDWESVEVGGIVDL